MSAVLRHRAVGALIALVALAMTSSLASATSIRSVAVDEMLDGAELVFEGQVLSVESFRNPGSKSVRTCVEFEVVEVIKGQADALLELCFAGGSAVGMTRKVEGLVYPKEGEHGIYFVESTSLDMVNPIYGWKQGHFVVDADADNTVTTTDGNPVLRIDPSDDRTVYTMDGVPRGAVVGPRSAARSRRGAPGMRADAFKARLRELMAEGR